MRTTIGWVLLAVSLLGAGCARDPLLAPKPVAEVVIGWRDQPRDQVLAEMIAGALQRAGTPARAEPSPRDDLDGALDRTQITLTPTFTTDPAPEADARAPEDVCDTVSRQLPQGISVSDCAEAVWHPDGGDGPGEYAVARYRSGTLLDAQLRRVNLVLGTISATELTDLAGRVGKGRPARDVAVGWLDAHSI